MIYIFLKSESHWNQINGFCGVNWSFNEKAKVAPDTKYIMVELMMQLKGNYQYQCRTIKKTHNLLGIQNIFSQLVQ